MDQLLELVETGVGLREEKTRNYPVAIYYGEEDAPEVKRRCRLLQTACSACHANAVAGMAGQGCQAETRCSRQFWVVTNSIIC